MTLMTYDYAERKQNIFTPEGIQMLVKIRDRAKSLCKTAGACRIHELISYCSGSSWDMYACVDYLVESGDLVEIPTEGVMTKGGLHYNISYRLFVWSWDRD